MSLWPKGNVPGEPLAAVSSGGPGTFRACRRPDDGRSRVTLATQAHSIVAVDFFRVDIVFLRAVLSSTAPGVCTWLASSLIRRARGWPSRPVTCSWIRVSAPKFLIRDREFTSAVDAIFTSIGIRIVKTRIQAPTANAIAERWVGTVRREYTDRLLILGERHSHHVPSEYTDHYDQHHLTGRSIRRHRLGDRSQKSPDVLRRDHRGGLIHEYQQVASGDTIFGTQTFPCGVMELLWIKKDVCALLR
jgi:putative transposase